MQINVTEVDHKKVDEDFSYITRKLIQRQCMITTMESCTSGFIASLITDTEGSSAIMKGAFVTYSNEVKVMEGVPEEVIENHGVYSKETALAMARTCRNKLSANIGLGITGTFGNPDPANADSVPGEVYVALSSENKEECIAVSLIGKGSRRDYKYAVAEAASKMIMQLLT